MNVLIVSPSLPFPLNNGGRIRTCPLAIQLAKTHSVTILCGIYDTESLDSALTYFEKHGVSLKTILVPNRNKKVKKRLFQLLSLCTDKSFEYYRIYSSIFQKEISETMASNDWDCLVVSFSQMGYFEYDTDAVSYLDFHNVESLLIKRTFEAETNQIRKLLAYSEWRKYKKHEIVNSRKFSKYLTTSENDRVELQKMGVGCENLLVPNGVDLDYYVPDNRSCSTNNVLFVGSINYYPNLDGLLHFAKKIWPIVIDIIPSASLTIVGKEPPSAIKNLAVTHDNIKVTGEVDDVRSYYYNASLVIVPLSIGSGTRLKILEAMAMAKPIVSTNIGAEGIDVTENNNILLENDPLPFANAIIEVLSNPGLQSRLGNAGRSLVEKKYGWPAIAQILTDDISASSKASVRNKK